MKKLLILILVFVSSFSFAAEPSSYSQIMDFIEGRTEHNPCDYYLEQEEVFKCGDKGYLLSYGNFYCNRFLVRGYPRMTTSGQDFIVRTLSCLQETMEKDLLNTPITSCPALKKMALEEHIECYLSSGFCHLKPHDLYNVKLVIKSKDIFFGKNFKVVKEVLKHCL